MKNIIKKLVEMDAMLTGFIWVSVLWTLSLPLMALEMWTTYLVLNAVIMALCLTHFYFIFRHLNRKQL